MSTDKPLLPENPLLKPKEAAALLRVDSRTVTRWAAAGRLESVRTLGGHHRYPADAVQTLVATLDRTSKDSTQ